MVIDTDKLTISELREIINKKEQEEWDSQFGNWFKTGVLKHDLFYLDIKEENKKNDENSLYDLFYDLASNEFYSEKNKQILSDKFKKSFKLAAKKGDKFFCILYDGEELWFADGCDLFVELSCDWAKKNLTSIKKCKNYDEFK